MARKRLVTVEEAILLHLHDYSRYGPDDTVPMELAQAGISQSLGVRRSHVSISLDTAKTREVVKEYLARVKGENRRRKCYFLTDSGKELAKSLRERVGSTIISAKLPDGTDFEGELIELMEKIHGFSLPKIALLATDGIVKLPLTKSHVAVAASQVPEIENFVGRKIMLDNLENFFNGDAKILMLSGMPGIGKTALAAKAAPSHDVFWFEINEWSGPRNLANNLSRFLSDKNAPRMERYLEAHEVPDIADLQDILLDIEFPLTMVYDDCQNASNSMTNFLKMLVSACGNSQHLKVGFLARDMPDILDIKQKITSDRIVQIVLNPLEKDESIELLRNRGIEGLAAENISKQSGGHPLYLVLAKSDDNSHEQNIEDMLARMIYQNLSDQENQMLHLLAVYRQLVGSDALVEDSEDIIMLENLEKKCIIFNAGGWGMHNLIRDFYYSRQSISEREARHEQAAEFYNAYSDDLDGQIEETYHLLKARDFESGILSLCSRGQDWLGMGFVDEILYLADLVPDKWQNPDDEYNINFLVASALDLVGDWDRASEHYGICYELACELEDLVREARTLRREGAILYRKGELADARKTFENALKILEKTSKPELLARVHGSLGVVHWRMGKKDKAKISHETDLEISQASKDKEGIARAQNNLGILDWEAGDYGTALERYSKALEIAGKLDDKKLVSILYSNIADVHSSKNEPAEAKRYYERCLELAEDLKFNWQVAEAYRGLAQVSDNKEKHLQRALAIFQRLGAEEDVNSVKELMRNP